MSARLATLHEMTETYGLEAAYDLLEIVQIDAYNDRLARKAAEAKGS